MALSANLLEVQEMLRNISMQEVRQVASGQSGKANQILGMDELKRRAEMESEAQGADAEAQQGQPPMIDEYLQMSQQAMGQGPPPPPQMPQGMPRGMPQMPQMQQGPPPSQRGIGSMMPPPPQRQMPQGMPPDMGQGMPPGMGQGIPQGPPPQMGMAGGGSVRGYAGPTGSRVGDPKVMASLDTQYQDLLKLDAEKQRYVALVREEAIRRGMDPDRAVAQIMQESAFDPGAISEAGAKGLAQFMPKTQPDVNLKDPFNPEDSIRAWGDYQGMLDKRYANDPARQLAAYNAGMGRVDRKFGSKEWEYPEADNYIARITGLTDRIKAGQQGLSRSLTPTGPESNNPLADLSSEQLSVMYRDGKRTEGGGLLGRFIPNWGSQTEAGLRQQQDITAELSRRSEGVSLNNREIYDQRRQVLGGDTTERTYEQFLGDTAIGSAARRVSDTRESLTSGFNADGSRKVPLPTDEPVELNPTKAKSTPTPIPMTDELMEQIVATSGDPIRSVNEEGEDTGFKKSLKDGKYKSLFDFMMMAGLQYASGSNLGEAGVAGLGYLGEQQAMDNEAGRRALRDRASQATIALSEEKIRRLKAGMSMTELRQEALKVLGKDNEFLMEKDPSKKEDMIQQMVAMIVGSGSGGANRVVVGQGGGEI